MVDLFEKESGKLQGEMKERFTGYWNEEIARHVEDGEDFGVDFDLVKAMVENSGKEEQEEGNKREEGTKASAHKDSSPQPSEAPSHASDKSGSQAKGRFYLHEVLAGSFVQKRPEEVVEKDPVLVARLEKLRHAVENRLYAKMVENVSNEWVKRREEVSRAEMKSGMDTAKLALNLIVSVIAVFAAAYWVVYVTYHDVITAISVATFAAIVIFLVEIILFVLRGSMLDSKVSQITEDIATGAMSPFPAAAPSILAAQAEEREAKRLARKKGISSSSSSSSSPSSSSTTPLILDATTPTTMPSNPFDAPPSSKVLSLDDFSMAPLTSNKDNKDSSSKDISSDFSSPSDAATSSPTSNDTSMLPHKNAKKNKKNGGKREEEKALQEETSMLLPSSLGSGGATLDDE